MKLLVSTRLSTKRNSSVRESHTVKVRRLWLNVDLIFGHLNTKIATELKMRPKVPTDGISITSNCLASFSKMHSLQMQTSGDVVTIFQKTDVSLTEPLVLLGDDCGCCLASNTKAANLLQFLATLDRTCPLEEKIKL